MGVLKLIEVARNGVPLIDLSVSFVEGIDFEQATLEFNSLGEDIDLRQMDWYDIPGNRTGSATAEALYRLFGWKNIRVPLVLQNPETKLFEETALFCWDEVEPISRYPANFEEKIASIGYGQPGSDDDGQWYEPDFG